MSRSEIIKNFITGSITQDPAENKPVSDVKVKDILKKELSPSDECNINVDLVETDEICVDNIYDSQGRMSDAIDAVTRITGYYSIPIRATDIPKEVEYLQRHTLYSLGDEVYAMHNEIRNDKVDEYCSRISNYIAQGAVFTEKLNRTFKYGGEVYPSLDLTKNEWTVIFSRFRLYKSRLYVKGGSDLIMEIYPERA